MVKKIVNLINRIVPKSNIIIFNSFPNISGNALAVYECIVDNHPEIAEKYRLVWVINDREIASANKLLQEINCKANYLVCSKKTIKGLWLYCRSKYIFSTHNYITGVNTYGNQKNINLWHGMPFKRIGAMIEDGGEKDVLQADITIATSPLFQKIMARAFEISENNVLVTGQPCNDQLFRTHNALKKLGMNKNQYRKILMWMPTYRKSIIGAIHEDGNVNGFGVQSVLSKNFDELNNLLKAQGYLLVIKPHPMDSINTLQLPESQNIRVLHNKDFDLAGVTLYEALGETDVLLTDYSSVFIDYLNSGKPIAFIFDDIDRYGQSRGFSFEKPMDYLPGEKIISFEALKNYIVNLDKVNEAWAEEREKITNIFNSSTEYGFSEKVINSIFNLGIKV